MPVPPVTALLLSTGGFVALVVFAFGMASLITDQDVIATPGVGQLPGAIGIAVAAAVFAASVWSVVRRGRPSVVSALWVALAAYLAYLVAVGLTAAFTGVDLGLAASVVGALAIGLFGPLLGVAAFVSACVAVLMVRARGDRPRWPWERPGAG